MASPTATQHIRSGLTIEMWDHDPDGTGATVVTPDAGTTLRYLDMRDYTHFSVAAMATIFGGASGITKLEIVASATTAFTSVTVIKDSGTIDADAIGDWAIEECTAQEVAQEGADAGVELRYVAGRLTCSNAGDEAVVAYVAMPKRPHLDLTPATTIS